MAQGHIRKSGEGTWELKFDAGRDERGKRITKYQTFKGTKREAQRRLADLITDNAKGEYIDPSKETMAAFLAHWLDHMRAHVSPRTHERYAEIVNKNIIPALGAMLLTKLRPEQIDGAYTKALTEGRRDGKGGLAPRTVHHMHRVLKQALRQAVRWRKLAYNPCDAAKPPKVSNKQMQTYDMAQTVELIEAMRGTRLLMPTLLAVLCGLRRGEVAALRWRSVDLAKGMLAVVESAEQTKAGIRYKPPKNDRSRTVALSATMVEELRRHRAGQAQELFKLGTRLTDDAFVVAQADGSPVQPRSLTHEWMRLIGKTTLPRIRFHDLRHAHATHLLKEGVHPKVASERLGHSKVGITLDLYSHVMPGMQADAAAKVDDALKAALQNRARGSHE